MSEISELFIWCVELDGGSIYLGYQIDDNPPSRVLDRVRELASYMRHEYSLRDINGSS